MDVEEDNVRHKREEAARKAKRKEKRSNKSATQLERERKRKEHERRTLKEANKSSGGHGHGHGHDGGGSKQQHRHHPSSSSSSKSTSKSRSKPKPPPPPSTTAVDETSKFQTLFTNRSQGFLIELNFRNAPPRPPVGPCFVGLGLDGELNDKWTKYKADNAIEANYSWKLHAEPDLGVPLAPSAMDYEGCYVDPTKVKPKKKLKKNNDNIHDLFEDDDDDDDDDDIMNDDDDDIMDQDKNHGKEKGGHDGTTQNNISLIVPLHPDDEALVNWKGHHGDTAAEDLQRVRDKARAEARLGKNHTGGKNGTTAIAINKKSTTMNSTSTTHTSSTLTPKKQKSIAKKKDFKSRVLNEQNPFFMKKTTYLANDHSQKVHDFKSLAQTKAEKEEEINKMLNSNKKSSDKHFIEQSFLTTSQHQHQHQHQTKTGTTGTKRKHPNKQNVVAEYEIPLLPDDETWGYKFIHVVIDNLPKDKAAQREFTDTKLKNAFIADAVKVPGKKMECNLLLPDDDSGNKGNENDDDDDDDNGNANGDKYNIAQRYELNRFALTEADMPDTNFVLEVDEEKGIATYHPISYRIQLSSGKSPDDTGSRLISKRALDDEEKVEIEEDLAMVDAELADKYRKEEEISQESQSQYPFGGGGDSSSEED